MKFLAISGSLRASSTNTALVRAIVGLAPAELIITIYDGLGDLPHFSPDLDGDNPPAAVEQLRELLRAADAVLICTPEYAYGMPGSLKNALDWTVSSGEFLDKPVAVLSASPNQSGGERAHASLRLTLTALSAQIIDKASLSIPMIRTKLNANGELTDAETTHALKTVLSALSQAVSVHAAH